MYYSDLPPGRIVTLGTPHNKSRIAEKFRRKSWGKFLLGQTVITGLKPDRLPSIPDRELGVIAGNIDIGSGWILGLPRPNDSLIAVDETQSARVKEHIIVPVSHSGLLLAKSVAIQIHTFLQIGHFIK